MNDVKEGVDVVEDKIIFVKGSKIICLAQNKIC